MRPPLKTFLVRRSGYPFNAGTTNVFQCSYFYLFFRLSGGRMNMAQLVRLPIYLMLFVLMDVMSKIQNRTLTMMLDGCSFPVDISV